MAKPFLLGILGGMGPLATLDFQQKLLQVTPAQIDQQHLPSVVWNVPQVADRQKALAGSGPSPLPQLVAGIKKLNQAGASHIVIPCNTAHHWFAELSQISDVEILHLVDTAVDALLQPTERPKRIGIIATQGTLDAGWYQQRLEANSIEAITGDTHEIREWFVPGCYAVKRGQLQEGGDLLSRQAEALLARGAQQLLLACTEVPVALRAINAPYLPLTQDPALLLAERCSRMWQDYCLENKLFY